MAGVVIERVMRGDKSVAVEPSLSHRPGDRTAVTGRRSQVVPQVDAILGPESADSSDMNLIAEVLGNPARSETPCTYADTLRGNREIPRPPRAAVAHGRIAKSKDARR